MADEQTREEAQTVPNGEEEATMTPAAGENGEAVLAAADGDCAIEFTPAPGTEDGSSPSPKRNQPTFGIGKLGVAIILVLTVGLVAWHVGFSPNPNSIGMDAGGFAG